MASFLHSPTRRRVLAAMLATGLAMTAAPGRAQPLSDRPIRIIALGTPGATADLVARLLGDAMAKSLRQPVIVENKPGGGGAFALDSLMTAPNDGHTYLVAVNSLVTEIPHSIKPKYDLFKAIKPLAELGGGGLVLVGDARLPPRTLEEMIAYVKAHPGKTNFASYSPGTLSHVFGLQLNKLAGLDMNHIGYKGSTPALQDIMGGSVQFMFDGQATSIPLIKAGKLRPFAITSPQRSDALPDVPTFAELGFKDLTRTSWMGLWTVPSAPAAIQARIRDEALKALADPVVRARLSSLGLSVDTKNPRTPEQLSKRLAEDFESVGALLRAVNYKPD
ncbi:MULTISPECIES: tripartite tricarboxylate transporter substrate binding protein [unclassified Cupriavidus]|uniref:Bug family tripartite tricarboxylate transporter substrate binding protein n=1 Tax=unclassified Cupriavidus TaxID=2640874 RepID=UPI00049059DC|nr:MULTISPECIES: tripartite tricarboxylate transporter substrate binding protein [unclassified Cupriavidus]MBP0630846.1 tripartite tricarboxylate transporter substrate binding protein [Cupriavidus sp. AcVe19-1a]MBP0634234.1 tripartite tricarboxylate transporter substrate binding protein [Cupriavidus sp. AcVe19-6a]